jgi:glycosyltransferase involved in cell wall biosynthesis
MKPTPPMRNAPTRVLHVFGRLQRGGAEMRTLEVLRRLEKDQFSFAMVALSEGQGGLESVATADGIAVEVCPLGPGFASRFTDLLKRLQVNVLHSHIHYTSGYLLWLARRAGVAQRIAHFRNTSDGQGNSPRRRVQRAVMRKLIDWYATDILAVSEGTMVEAWRDDWQADRRCRVIFNGLDTSRFDGASAPQDVRREFGWAGDAPLFINVASFQPAKNQIRVVQVFKAIADRDPDARLVFVGREVSGYQAQVRELVSRLSLEKKVVFAGERADVPRLLKASDVLLFPSRWEGLPGAVLESCAAGVPVVGSDIPGVLEIARYFPTVTALSLSDSNAAWADRGLAAVAVRRQARSRNDFEHTPFALGCAAQSLHDVYERAS